VNKTCLTNNNYFK